MCKPPEQCDYTSISDATEQEGAFGNITVRAGTYNEPEIQVYQGQFITSVSGEAGSVIVDGGGSHRVFYIRGTHAVLRGLIIQNGNSGSGEAGGIWDNAGDLTVQKCIIRNNRSDSYIIGGINFGARGKLIDSVVENNSAIDIGGVRARGEGFLMLGSTIRNNHVVGRQGYGSAAGGLYLLAGGRILQSEITGNTVTWDGARGGGVLIGGYDYTPAVISNTTISGNRVEGANASGGGIAIGAALGAPPVRIEGGSITGNRAIGSGARGGGIATHGAGRLEIFGTGINGNQATSEGGGVYDSPGGAASAYEGADISNNQVTDSGGSGGGLRCSAGDAIFWAGSATSNTPDDIAGCMDRCASSKRIWSSHRDPPTASCITELSGACSDGIAVCDDGMYSTCEPTVAPTGEDCAQPNGDADCDGVPASQDIDCTKGVTTAANHEGSGTAGDPVNTLTGELTQRFPPDLALDGPLPLVFSRYYASGLQAQNASGTLGTNWRHSFEWKLAVGSSRADITTSTGRTVTFVNASGAWELRDRTDVAYRLSKPGVSWWLLDPTTHLNYRFDAAGTLIAIIDAHANELALTYSGGLLATVSDGKGRTLTFTHSSGRLTRVTDGVRQVNFAASGANLASVTGARGKTTTYAYGSGGLLLSETLPEGNAPYAQVYDGSGRVTRQTDALGNETAFAWNGFSTTITAAGGTTVHTHDRRGVLVSVQDEAGETFALSYDPEGRRTGVADRLGGTTRAAFQSFTGMPSSLTDAAGATTRAGWTVVVQRYVPRVFLASLLHPDGAKETFARDGSGRVTTYTDGTGAEWSYTWNDMGRLLSATNPLGGARAQTWSANGTLLTSTDASGNTTSYVHDALGRLERVDLPGGASRTYAWDADDHVTSFGDELGGTVMLDYDDNGDLASVTDQAGATISYQRDGMRRVTGLVDALGETTAFARNALGRLASVTLPSGATTEYGYDARGRRTTITDGASKTWSLSYDAEGALSGVIDPMGNETLYARDANGRLKGVTTPRGHATLLVRDARGRVTKVTDAMGGETTQTWDGAGRLTSMVDHGVSVMLNRDPMGNLTRLTDPLGKEWLAAYDAAGRLVSRTDPLARATTLAYDARNRPATITYPGGLGAMTLSYDARGALTRRVSGALDIPYTYDAVGRLKTSAGLALDYDENGRLTASNGLTLTRDEDGRIETLTLAASKSVTYAYDGRGLVTAITDWTSATTSFEYDGAGRLTRIVRPNGVNTTYTWDADGAIAGFAHGAVASATFTRDARGRVTTAERTGPLSAPVPTAASESFSYDDASQLAGATHDALGRMTARGAATFTWDAAGRLVAAGAVANEYDGLGLRTSRSGRAYVWCYAFALPSISVERESGADVRYYVHTPGGRLVYSIDAAGARRDYHFDEMGNALALTGPGGAVVAAYLHDPYGRLLASSGATDNAFTWRGEHGVMDEGAGLYYVRARFYDAGAMRFLSRDPVPSTEPRRSNPYAYALGDPRTYVDPDGREGEHAGKLLADLFVGERAYVRDDWAEILIVQDKPLSLPQEENPVFFLDNPPNERSGSAAATADEAAEREAAKFRATHKVIDSVIDDLQPPSFVPRPPPPGPNDVPSVVDDLQGIVVLS